MSNDPKTAIIDILFRHFREYGAPGVTLPPYDDGAQDGKGEHWHWTEATAARAEQMIMDAATGLVDALIESLRE